LRELKIQTAAAEVIRYRMRGDGLAFGVFDAYPQRIQAIKASFEPPLLGKIVSFRHGFSAEQGNEV
jgi:hypothetical protein